MKKLKVIAVVVGLFLTGSATAQSKIGYISVDNMVALMPEVAKIDTLLQKFQVDSLQPRYTYTLSEYMRKDSMLKGKEADKLPASVKAQVQEEVQSLGSELSNWQTVAQQLMENKQAELLQPVYKKVLDAIKEVAKEKGYTHVFNKEAFIVAPDGDDLLTVVAEKLKVKVPQQVNKTTPNIKPKNN